MKIFKVYLLSMIIVCGALRSFAQKASDHFPLKMQTEEGITIDHQKKFFKSKGPAIIEYQDAILKADHLQGYYHESLEKKQALTKIEAYGHITVSYQGGLIIEKADTMQYDLPLQKIEVQGKQLVLHLSNAQVCTSAPIFCSLNEKYCVAVGAVSLKHPALKASGQSIFFTFKEKKSGVQVASKTDSNSWTLQKAKIFGELKAQDSSINCRAQYMKANLGQEVYTFQSKIPPKRPKRLASFLKNNPKQQRVFEKIYKQSQENPYFEVRYDIKT